MSKLENIAKMVEKGKNLEIPAIVKDALDEGFPPYEIMVKGLQAGLLAVGERFKRNQCFIPEVLLSARAMKSGMEILRPELLEIKVTHRAKVVLGTVKDDLHDIGKNMVGMMMEGSGFQIIDLGINVSGEKFVQSVQKENPTILAMSSLLSTTMPNLGKTIKLLVQKGLRDKVKVMIGGAPVTEKYAINVGADAYAADAVRAVDEAMKLLN